jgi:RND family efflux transporter MFP subunit
VATISSSASSLLRRSALGLVLSSALVVSACGNGQPEAKDEARSHQSVSAATATTLNLPHTIVASGTVSAWEEVPVASEVGGMNATAVYVDEGSYVRQGQVLVKMNDALLRAQLSQQQASVQSAEANSARDDAALARAYELKERGFLSQAALDTALANQRSSLAALNMAKAALSETRTRLAQSEIRAPVAGLIVSRSVTRGQMINAGTELFRLVRDGRLELDAQVPDTDLGALRPGQRATVTSNQGGTAEGTIRIVTPEVNADTRLGVARISLSNATGFKPGMFARASINAGERANTAVPTAAVLYRDNQSGVFVLGSDNAVIFTPVNVLSRADDQTAVSGVSAGAKVVVAGAGFLNTGDKVNVTSTVAATPSQPAPATAPATK